METEQTHQLIIRVTSLQRIGSPEQEGALSEKQKVVKPGEALSVVGSRRAAVIPDYEIIHMHMWSYFWPV